ncbi:hypothetical protein AYJ57_21605 (plasmid) [Salipiger sp. CCB-MM3]|uniref:exonuclease domain-containing protein n=1 Tax=Salipiger sp. CCB-MM3 TaxID=1792508 RepID=UPI00080AB4B5|nr:exonuclease domain-containing protein [Salipiger sp. CCB-MM3]ANT63070.1 hypothetical protein AYJ57_21605 [Salipiger sp. CCB-MM3]
MAIKLMGRRAPKKPSLPEFNYIGYDFEALGLFCDTDQPMQAAFVKLDQNLDVIKTVNLKIARTPYAVPGPKALEVTGLRPSDLTSSDRVTEYEAAKEVSKTVGTRSAVDGQKTVIFGYNILSYDERLLRYFLFRNLQDTYLTTGKDVRRLDLYPAFQYLDFIRPGIIKPGTKDDGSVSWRLSDVMIANGMISDNAHDAEADTLMTKDLLVIFVRAAPSVFHQFVDLSNKKYVGSLIQKHMTGGDFLFEFRTLVHQRLRRSPDGEGRKQWLQDSWCRPGYSSKRVDAHVGGRDR